jgi:U3 small nucleolar RNA-associated protein 12
MVKTYSKYELSQTFGTITSATSNVLSIPDEGGRSNTAGRAVLAANEEVYLWDVKKGELLGKWRDGNNKAQVTTVARSATDPDLFAVGYGIRILGF